MDDHTRHLKKGLQKARRINLMLMICILIISLGMLIYFTKF